MKATFRQVVGMTVILAGAALLTGCSGGGIEAVSSAAEPGVNIITVPADPAANPPATVDPLGAPMPNATGTNAVLNTVPTALPKLSPGLSEVITLAQAQVGEEVLLAYVQNSSFSFSPTVEEVVYLHDLGVTDKVIAAMIQKGQSMQATNAVNTAQAVIATPAHVPAAPVVAPAEPTYVAPPDLPQATEDATYFYPELQPYGSWVQLVDYGWCWQPSVAVIDVGWRPYCDRGRWVWTDCGWYWQSDYSWGWAPFHYGRWFHHANRGWVWAPDRTWGPAWVSWRYSNDYCGWAALPPAAHFRPGHGFVWFNATVGDGFEFGLGTRDYNFVRTDRFYSHDLRPFYLPGSQVNRVFSHTTVANHISMDGNRRVITSNVPVEQVSKASKTEITRVTVHDMPASNSRVRPDRLVRSGSNTEIFRPSVAEHNSAPPITRTVIPSAGTPAGGTRPQAAAGTMPTGQRRDLINMPLARNTPAVENGFATLQRPSPPRTVETPGVNTPNSNSSTDPNGTIFRPLRSRSVTSRQEIDTQPSVTTEPRNTYTPQNRAVTQPITRSELQRPAMPNNVQRPGFTDNQPTYSRPGTTYNVNPRVDTPSRQPQQPVMRQDNTARQFRDSTPSRPTYSEPSRPVEAPRYTAPAQSFTRPSFPSTPPQAPVHVESPRYTAPAPAAAPQPSFRSEPARSAPAPAPAPSRSVNSDGNDKRPGR